MDKGKDALAVSLLASWGTDAPLLGIGGTATLEAASGDQKGPRKFNMMAYSGGKLYANWEYPAVVNLANLRESKFIRSYREHDSNRIVGHIGTVKNDGRTLNAQAIVSGAGKDAEEVVKAADNSFQWQSSINVTPIRREFLEAGQKTVMNGQEIDGPCYLVQEGVLQEISFVAKGGDENATATIAAAAAQSQGGDAVKFEDWLKAKGWDKSQLKEAQLETLKAAWKAETQVKADADKGGDKSKSDPAKKPEDVTAAAGSDKGDDLKAAGGSQPKGESADDAIGDLRAKYAAEKKRLAQIEDLCAGEHAELAATAIAEGWTIEKTELEVLRAGRPEAPRANTGEGKPAQSDVLEAALLRNQGWGEADLKAAGLHADACNEASARNYDGYGAHALVIASLQAGSLATGAGVVNDVIIDKALAQDMKASFNGSLNASFSSVSVSGILSNIANKSMLRAFGATKPKVLKLCKPGSLKDFKEAKTFRVTAEDILDEVGPSGELKSADIKEAEYSNRLKTYGRLIVINRQMLMNDDLGAFTEIPDLFGRMAYMRREKDGFTKLLQAIGTFISAANLNYTADANSNLSIDGLTLIETGFGQQKGEDGEFLDIDAKYLLVPKALRSTADTLMTSQWVNETTTANKAKAADNPHKGKYEVISTPYIGANTTIPGSLGTDIQWGLFADPMIVPALMVAHLNGRMEPTLERVTPSMQHLGFGIRTYFDYGFGLGEKRGVHWSKGAA